MPVTASSFNINGGTPQQIASFNQALQYLQQSPVAASMLTDLSYSGVTIQFGVGNNNTTSSSATGTVITWDTAAGHMVYGTGTAEAQSPALALLHEVAHALDPNIRTETVEQAESIAVATENVAADQLGEPTRIDHSDGATRITVSDATEHTVNGDWVVVAADGSVTYGGAFDGSNQGPDIGNDGGDEGGDDGGDDGGYYGGYGGDYGGGGGGGGGGDYGGCVEVGSFLPGGGTAGKIIVGGTMQLADQSTLEAGSGIVTYSEAKSAPGFRIFTQSGATLVCSDTAPIPTPEGLVLAPHLLGKLVAVRRDDGGANAPVWEDVVKVDEIGTIQVQHITVGDKCFWAGEQSDAFILHHNMKDGGGGGGGYYGYGWRSSAAVSTATMIDNIDHSGDTQLDHTLSHLAI